MDTRNGKKRGSGILEYARAKGKLWILVCGVIVGVLLLLVGGGIGEATESSAEAVSSDAAEGAAELSAYQKALEARIEAMCESVAGVSQADVMVTLGSGCRVIYATDDKGEIEKTGTGSAQRPVYRTVQPPAVEGVGVVCKGGDDPRLQCALIELISTAIGIASNRVCVVGK